LNGDGVGLIAFQGRRSDGLNFTAATIRGVARDNWAAVVNPAAIIFATVPDGAQDLVDRWEVNQAGHFLAGTDNTLDIGASGATRPRTIYARTSVVAQGATNSLTLADGSLTQSSGTLIVAATAGVTQIRAGGANHIEFNTNGAVRWEITSAGHLIAPTADNTYDIGASGATRPRTGYFGTALNVGNGVTASTTNGDIRAGDGTSALAWANGSGGALNITASGNVRAFQVNTNRDGNNILGHTNSSTGASAQASWRATCDGASMSISAVAGNYGALVADTGFMRISSPAAINFRSNGTAERWTINENTLIGGQEATTATLQGRDATTAATAGANLTISAGDGNTSGAGGVLNLTSGASASGTPGTVQVNSLPLPTVLSSTTGVNIDTISTDSLFLVPTGRSAIITSVMIRLTTATSPNADAIVSVGTNGAAYDNIIASTTLTGLDAITETFVLTTEGLIHTAAATETVTLNISTADSGGTVTATVELIGYLI
jgi:hypothetical protein